MSINLKLLSAVAPLAIATAVALSSQATVRDQRTTTSQPVAPTETRLDLRVGQPLKLDGGKSLILRPGGVLEIIEMNGRVARTFRDATIIEDGNGVVWIIAPNNIVSPNNISGFQRVRAGMLQRTSPSSRGAVRDHRTPQAVVRDHRTTQGTVRDHRPSAPQSDVFTAELTPNECEALGGKVEFSRNCAKRGDQPLMCTTGKGFQFKAVCINELDSDEGP